jgi:hypothetical protein
MSQDQNSKDIGELTGILHTFIEETRLHRLSHTRKMEELHKCVQLQSEKMEVRFKAIEKELSLYAFIYKFVKVVGLVLAAILTFKFGDITNIWQKVFKQ